MNCSYVRHASFICMCRDTFICVTWLNCMCVKTHSNVWHYSFVCTSWFIHMYVLQIVGKDDSSRGWRKRGLHNCKIALYLHKRAFHLRKRALYLRNRDLHLRKRVLNFRTRALYLRKRALYLCKRVLYVYKRVLYLRKRAVYFCQRALHLRKECYFSKK